MKKDRTSVPDEDEYEMGIIHYTLLQNMVDDSELSDRNVVIETVVMYTDRNGKVSHKRKR